MNWTPYDLPHLTHKTADSFHTIGTAWLNDPVMSHHPQATTYAAHLNTVADLLTTAPHTWMDKGVTDLINDTHEDVPDWSPSSCMPGDAGLIFFEKHMGELPWISHITDEPVPTPLDGFGWHTVGGSVKIFAFTRTAHILNHLTPTRHDAPLHDAVSATIGLDAVAGAGMNYVPAPTMDNPDQAPTTGQALLSVVGATWLLMAQPAIMEYADLHTARVKHRAGGVVTRRDVRISIRTLTRAQREPSRGIGGHGQATTRWWVRGHWRQQAWGPGRALRKPVFIAPHTAGAQGVEVDDRPQVQVWRG